MQDLKVSRNRLWIIFPQIDDYKSDILGALDASMKKIAASHALLLEANPLVASTDTALFSSIADLDSTFRFRNSKDNSMHKISF